MSTSMLPCDVFARWRGRWSACSTAHHRVFCHVLCSAAGAEFRARVRRRILEYSAMCCVRPRARNFERKFDVASSSILPCAVFGGGRGIPSASSTSHPRAFCRLLCSAAGAEFRVQVRRLTLIHISVPTRRYASWYAGFFLL